MPTASPHFSSLLRSQHNYVRAMPALKLQQNLRQNPMISHSHKAVFIHVPKTAGQSVEQAFLRDLGLDWAERAPLLLRSNDDASKGPPRLAHLTAGDYVALGHMTASEWSEFHRFSVVRDPFSRAVSLYRHRGPNMGFRDWVMSWLTATLSSNPDDAQARWFVRPQVEFLCDELGEILVGTVMRFETLGIDFAAVAKDVGLKSRDLPRRNTTGHKPQPDINGEPPRMERLARSLRRRITPSRFERLERWQDHYDTQTADRVASLYAGDFETFGYDRAGVWS
jgi:hypothetical protein